MRIKECKKIKKETWYDIRSYLEENACYKTFSTLKKARKYYKSHINAFYTGDIMPPTEFNKKPFKIQSATICKIVRTKSNRWKRTSVFWNKQERKIYNKKKVNISV